MKINSVSKINKNEYPSENEITDKKIKHSIPTRWRKLGISAFVFEIIMQANIGKSEYVFAALSGIEYPSYYINGCYIDKYKDAKIATGSISVVSIVLFITSLVILIKKNKKAKKENKKVKGKVIFMILSIVSGVLAILAALVYGYVRLFLA